MKFTDEEKHRDTLAVLREVLDYLERLPPVPTTQALCAKVATHLDKPAQRLVAESKRELVGHWITPAGQLMFDATLRGDMLTVSVPDPAADRRQAHRRDDVVQRVVQQLMRHDGVTVKLVRRPPASTKLV
ncbi:MAG: hypothetical protein VB125_00225 [Burkholderia sp.]